ncbi:hypothetical protein N2152v2_010168 [Parachlorella kessleri]
MEKAESVKIKSETEGVKQFTFDQAYGVGAEQENVYHGTATALVDAVLQGYNGSADKDYLVRVSHLEVYNEEIRDLLSKDPKAKLDLRESPERGVYVKGLREFVVKSAAEMAAVLQVGTKNRSVEATLMNQDSSRSHSIFTIIVETVVKADGASAAGSGAPPASPSKPQQQKGGQIRVGKLNLVDLAGSERQSKTQASGDRLKEAAKINLSLSALGNVISALTSDSTSAQHIPYRDSKLTRLLQDSLGGNAKTVMIANVGPADYNYEETLSTLRYAARAKFIKNKPRVNEDPKDAMLREFQEEIARLKTELAAKQAWKSKLPSAASTSEAALETPDSPGQQTTGSPQLAIVKDALREDILRQLQQAASLEALKRAKLAAEQAAQQRLEAELAVKHASEEERQRAAQALEQRRSELQQYVAAAEQEQQEKLLLKQRIRAMESKVLRGGENLLDKVEALEAAAVKAEAALAAQRAQQAEQERRIAQLEEATILLEGKYSSVQEEISEKAKKLAKVAQATAATQAQARQMAEECQAERERLLDDMRALTKQIKLKDLVISAYIPTEYQQTILSRCHWEDSQQRWAVTHIEWAGNLVRARREAEASLSSSEASGSSSGGSTCGGRQGTAAGVGIGESVSENFGANLFHGDSDRLSNVYFSYKDVRPPSSRVGSAGTTALAGRPRTAALQARQGSRPVTAALAGRQWG